MKCPKRESASGKSKDSKKDSRATAVTRKTEDKKKTRHFFVFILLLVDFN